MTFDEFLVLHARSPRPRGQRNGQWVFNHVHLIRPDVANQLRGTPSDCFYSDEMISAFLDDARGLWGATDLGAK